MLKDTAPRVATRVTKTRTVNIRTKIAIVRRELAATTAAVPKATTATMPTTSMPLAMPRKRTAARSWVTYAHSSPGTLNRRALHDKRPEPVPPHIEPDVPTSHVAAEG